MLDQINTNDTAASDRDETVAGDTYQAPVLRPAGSAVALVQGYSFMSGYDMCGHGIYEC